MSDATVVCLAVDLLDPAGDTPPDPDAIAARCELAIQYDEDGAIAVHLLGGRGPERRVLVASEVLRFALQAAGVPWAQNRTAA